MSINEHENTIIAYLDGTLSSAEKHAFDQHLTCCPECKQAMMAAMAADEVLKQISLPTPPSLTNRIMNNLPESPPSGGSPSISSGIPPWITGVGIGLALVAGITLFSGKPANLPNQDVTDHQRSAPSTTEKSQSLSSKTPEVSPYSLGSRDGHKSAGQQEDANLAIANGAMIETPHGQTTIFATDKNTKFVLQQHSRLVVSKTNLHLAEGSISVEA